MAAAPQPTRRLVDAESVEEAFGSTARDSISGFVGVVVGYAQYISGCNQALLVPRVTDAVKPPEGMWFDVQRLELLEDLRIKLDNGATPGCDLPAPVR